MIENKPRVERGKVDDLINEKIAGILNTPDNAEGFPSDGYVKVITETADILSAVADLMARELGMSGWQWSVMTLRALGLMRDIEGPFMIVDAEQALYPQYDLPAKVHTFLMSEGTRAWLADEAQKRLDKNSSFPEGGAVDTVVAHWKQLVADRPLTSENSPTQ